MATEGDHFSEDASRSASSASADAMCGVMEIEICVAWEDTDGTRVDEVDTSSRLAENELGFALLETTGFCAGL